MRGLFFKIFIIFWIAQSLIFMISTALIVRHHFESPDVLFDALHSSLENDAQRAADAYETGGCDAVQPFRHGASSSRLPSKMRPAHDLCNPHGLAMPAAVTEFPTRIVGTQLGAQYIWRVPAASPSGKHYVFLLAARTWQREHSLVARPGAFCFAAAAGSDRDGRIDDLRPGAPVYAAHRAAAKSGTRTGYRQARRPGQLAQFTIAASLAATKSTHSSTTSITWPSGCESLVDAQKLLLRDVSHELRSPLVRLSVALELAREDADPVMAPHLERIERETGRLNSLIGQLLTLSSMEALEKVENFEPLSLNSLLEQMIPDAEYEARQRQCSVAFHSSGECIIPGNRNCSTAPSRMSCATQSGIPKAAPRSKSTFNRNRQRRPPGGH